MKNKQLVKALQYHYVMGDEIDINGKLIDPRHHGETKWERFQDKFKNIIEAPFEGPVTLTINSDLKYDLTVNDWFVVWTDVPAHTFLEYKCQQTKTVVLVNVGMYADCSISFKHLKELAERLIHSNLRQAVLGK